MPGMVSYASAYYEPECALFARILREVKENSEGCDTAWMIADALAKFAEESGVKGVACGAPYAGTFEF